MGERYSIVNELHQGGFLANCSMNPMIRVSEAHHWKESLEALCRRSEDAALPLLNTTPNPPLIHASLPDPTLPYSDKFKAMH